ncbi:MAG TPA: CoA transferase [Acidimicrobiales bacterium]|nr:CoA transferase [Acidimicrobiales bacterium]
MDPAELTPNGPGSLAGLTVGRLEAGLASEVAAWLLAQRGASVLQATPASSAFAVADAKTVDATDCAQAELILTADHTGRGHAGGGAGAVLRPAPIICPDAGIPAGTLEYVTGTALATAALAAWRCRTPIAVSELGVAIQVFLPEVMAVSYGSPWWPVPPDPVPAPGGGWLSTDLGAAGDDELYAGLLATLPADADAATIATAAQEWRLAVCAYRPRVVTEPEDPILDRQVLSTYEGVVRTPAVATRAPLGDVRICDLTAMWAGPLATWLLARLGAGVYKVEPAVRLDGTRALSGGGIYPGGIQRRPGEDSALFQALNHGKVRLPLDLRVPLQRDQFLARAHRSHVVIDSFTPRVMPNFGLTPPVLNPGMARPMVVSMPAFGPGPHRDWVAFGTGVHALSGLGDRGDGTFAAPSVAYPDVVAGFTAAFAIVSALVGRDRGRPPPRIEVPLSQAVQPLLAIPPAGGMRPQEAGGVLYDAGLAAHAFAPLQVAGMQLMHPKGPFSLLPAR